MRKTLPALMISMALLLLPGRASAIDQFEIQVYDAETAGPAAVGVELHANVSAAGTKTASPEGELPTDRVFRFTLEPHIGLTRWLELGGYLQTAAHPDGQFNYAGVKLRLKGRVPFRLASGLIGLALNVEAAFVPPVYEANRYGFEMRPVVDLRWRLLYVSVNPIVPIDLAGPHAGQPQLEPAAKLALRLPRGVAIGAEYYAALGPMSAPLPREEQIHRLFGVVDFVHGAFDLNAGVGYGYAAGDRWIVKMILGYDFGR